MIYETGHRDSGRNSVQALGQAEALRQPKTIQRDHENIPIFKDAQSCCISPARQQRGG